MYPTRWKLGAPAILMGSTPSGWVFLLEVEWQMRNWLASFGFGKQTSNRPVLFPFKLRGHSSYRVPESPPGMYNHSRVAMRHQPRPLRINPGRLLFFQWNSTIGMVQYLGFFWFTPQETHVPNSLRSKPPGLGKRVLQPKGLL